MMTIVMKMIDTMMTIQTSYDKQYKKVDKEESDRPVIIVKNKIPIPSEEKREKEVKEPSMVLVNKEVLFCDGDGCEVFQIRTVIVG